MTTTNRQTYLVEHYRPGVQIDELTQSASLVRDAVGQMEREGKAVEYVSSTIVPRDEYFVAVVVAASEDLVREAYARAGIAFERISTAFSLGPA
jgi:hypothetical protein